MFRTLSPTCRAKLLARMQSEAFENGQFVFHQGTFLDRIPAPSLHLPAPAQYRARPTLSDAWMHHGKSKAPMIFDLVGEC